MKKLAGMRNYGISAIKLNGSGTGSLKSSCTDTSVM